MIESTGLGKWDKAMSYRVTQYTRVFCGLTISQWTQEFWGVTRKTREKLGFRSKKIRFNKKNVRKGEGAQG